jgi:hypothetical protein
LNLLRWYQGNCLCIFLSLYERDEREEREERDNRRRRRRVTLTRTTQNYKTETRSTRKQRACATTAATTTTTTTRRTEKKQQHNKRRNKPQALASALSLYHSLCVACEFANVFGLCAFLLPSSCAMPFAYLHRRFAEVLPANHAPATTTDAL